MPQHGRTLSSTRARTQRINSVCDSARGCPAAMSKHPEQQQDATDSAGRLTRASPASPALQSSHPTLTFYPRAFPQALIASVQRRSCGAFAAPPRRQRQRPLCMSRHAVARRGCHRSPSHRGLRTSRQLPTAAVPLDLLDYQSHSPWRCSWSTQHARREHHMQCRCTLAVPASACFGFSCAAHTASLHAASSARSCERMLKKLEKHARCRSRRNICERKRVVSVNSACARDGSGHKHMLSAVCASWCVRGCSN